MALHLNTKIIQFTLITGVPYRIYLVNMLEFDPLNNFHLHGNLFDYYSSGTSLKADYKSDIVPLMQGDRGILEFKYPVSRHVHVSLP